MLRTFQPRFGQCLGAMVSMVTMTSGLRRVAAHSQLLRWLHNEGCPPESQCYGHIQMDRPFTAPTAALSRPVCSHLTGDGWDGLGWSSPTGVTSKVGMTPGLGIGPFPSLGTDSHKVLPSHPIPGLEGPAAPGTGSKWRGPRGLREIRQWSPGSPVESIKKKMRKERRKRRHTGLSLP